MTRSGFLYGYRRSGFGVTFGAVGVCFLHSRPGSSGGYNCGYIFYHLGRSAAPSNADMSTGSWWLRNQKCGGLGCRYSCSGSRSGRMGPWSRSRYTGV